MLIISSPLSDKYLANPGKKRDIASYTNAHHILPAL
jgi:hypothetical protein